VAGRTGPDEFGRCSSHYHDLECAHGTGVDWLASGAPRETYTASLANWAAGLNLSNEPLAIWDDPDDEDGTAASVIPFSTMELAHELAGDLGLFDDAPYLGAPGLDDLSLIRPPAASIGYGSSPPPALTRPGISELARDLGLR